MQFIADGLGGLFIALMVIIISAFYLMMFLNKKAPEATKAGKKAAGDVVGNLLLKVLK